MQGSLHHIRCAGSVPLWLWEKGTGKEGVMVKQDYLFLAFLFMILFFFGHWGGFRHLRH